MQSKGAKIGFFILLIGFGLGAYWFYNHGPFAKMKDATRHEYQNYVKAEATVISKENSRARRSSRTVWTLQFKDSKGEFRTATLDQNSLTKKEIGEKIIIYYKPENPNVVTSEESYNETMK